MLLYSQLLLYSIRSRKYDRVFFSFLYFSCVKTCVKFSDAIFLNVINMNFIFHRMEDENNFRSTGTSHHLDMV